MMGTTDLLNALLGNSVLCSEAKPCHHLQGCHDWSWMSMCEAPDVHLETFEKPVRVSDVPLLLSSAVAPYKRLFLPLSPTVK